jgi:hypothetical protein
VNKRLDTVNQLIQGGYKLDFDLIYAITTEVQVRNYGLDDFMPKVGLELVFKGDKNKDDPKVKHRHKETGSLYMWAVHPNTYKEKLEAYKDELVARKDIIDPPKKPDPARQKFPDLKLSDLRKAGLVQANAGVDNPLSQILTVPPAKAEMFIKMKFGLDVKVWTGWGKDWTEQTTRILKDAHARWKAELV